MKINLFIAGILTVASFPLANAQAPSAGAPANRDPSEISGVGNTANFSQLVNQQHGSMQFFGKVVVDGAGLPWNPIPVAVVCDGKTRYNTVTDAKGGFGIMVDAKLPDSEIVKTKTDLGRVTAAQLVGCKVNAVLDGFDSTPVTIANRDVTDSPDIGTIHLHHNEAAAGSSISPTTASAPADAMKEFDKAHSDEIGNHMDSARKHLQKAVNIYPQFAEAWYQLGRLEEAEKPDDALSAYQKAAAADPKYTPPYEHIAAICAVEKKWQDVVDATNHALQLVPAGTPQIWYFDAVGNYNLRQCVRCSNCRRKISEHGPEPSCSQHRTASRCHVGRPGRIPNCSGPLAPLSDLHAARTQCGPGEATGGSTGEDGAAGSQVAAESLRPAIIAYSGSTPVLLHRWSCNDHN